MSLTSRMSSRHSLTPLCRNGSRKSFRRAIHESKHLVAHVQLDKDLSVRRLTLFHIVVSAFNILWIIFTIVCVEFTLVYNHVLGVLAGDGLASAGQLLPLLIGLFSTGRLCWIIYKDNRDKRRATPGEESPQHVEVHKEKTRPIRQLKRGISFQRRKKEGVLWHSLLTGWMPWLNCFPAWQKLGPQPQPELRREVVTASPDVENQTYQVVTKS